MIETYRGSVNTWECDENNHQNVRFYLWKMQQGLTIGVAKLGLTTPNHASTLLRGVTSHHIRFLREAQVAVPQVIHCGVLSFDPQGSLRLLSLMTNSTNQELSAAFITEIAIDEQISTLLKQRPPIQTVTAPTAAQPRGLEDATSAYATLPLQQAYALGFAQVGAGVISSAECGIDGLIEPYQVMGRMSDGMPNLWALFQTEAEQRARSEGITGGAVLEYHLNFHQPIPPGTSFSHLAGIRGVGNKTQNICHLIYDAASEHLLVSAEALGISMDLNTRKSMVIPDTRRERIKALLLQPLQ